MGLLERIFGEKEGDVVSTDISGLYEQRIQDMEEKRTLSDNKKLQKAIMDYQDPENTEKREIFVFEEEINNNPDYYLPYYWSATHKFNKGNFEQAKEILIKGIEKCKLKSVLCRRLAEFYFMKGHLENALYWFFTALMASSSDTDFHSYFYLGYIFEAHGMKDASQLARRKGRGIAYRLFYDTAEYSKSKAEKIKTHAVSIKNEKTLKMLKDFYRYEKKNLFI
ncbi:hypothetical protein CUJ83_03925 [Methanocella sp. CWC-04]|uniref:Tetratricopeptide repeat-containing protein n=1 Tax=Methanooceanicella nereidis TaxID=2052831 RepID=A0AAP2RBZ3_9EURY|nr:hypothetical protein [Methanocella sp. CWC-04]MCD1294141.1 hypothetical protein [Methanocella sp. CWC-04]